MLWFGGDGKREKMYGRGPVCAGTDCPQPPWKVPRELGCPSLLPRWRPYHSVFHENSKKHISTAPWLMLLFLHQRVKVLKHYKEMDLENVSHMP